MWTNPPEQIHDFERERQLDHTEGADAEVMRERLNHRTLITAAVIGVILVAIVLLAVFA